MTWLQLFHHSWLIWLDVLDKSSIVPRFSKCLHSRLAHLDDLDVEKRIELVVDEEICIWYTLKYLETYILHKIEYCFLCIFTDIPWNRRTLEFLTKTRSQKAWNVCKNFFNIQPKLKYLSQRFKSKTLIVKVLLSKCYICCRIWRIMYLITYILDWISDCLRLAIGRNRSVVIFTLYFSPFKLLFHFCPVISATYNFSDDVWFGDFYDTQIKWKLCKPSLLLIFKRS